MAQPKFKDNEEWAHYLTKALDLEPYESEELLHDLNNLRADEWFDTLLENDIPSPIIKEFKRTFKITQRSVPNKTKEPNALDPEDKKLMQKYNRTMKKAEEMLFVLENHLQNRYGIDETDGCSFNGKFTKPFEMGSICPIYEWGTRRFDIKQIEKIIKFKNEFEKKTGETPDLADICRHFSK